MKDAGSYDRYTPLKNFPGADFWCIAWPVGLVQLSKNPFKKGNNPNHLGNIAMNVLEKYKSKLEHTKVSLDYIKYTLEKKATEQSVGFTTNDLYALYTGMIRKNYKTRGQEQLKLLIDKKYSDLTDDEKKTLRSLYRDWETDRKSVV